MDIIGLGEVESLRTHPISFNPHAQDMLGLSECLHRKFFMKAPLQSFDICLIAPSNEHIIDIQDDVDLGLVIQLSDIHVWLGV